MFKKYQISENLINLIEYQDNDVVNLSKQIISSKHNKKIFKTNIIIISLLILFSVSIIIYSIMLFALDMFIPEEQEYLHIIASAILAGLSTFIISCFSINTEISWKNMPKILWAHLIFIHSLIINWDNQNVKNIESFKKYLPNKKAFKAINDKENNEVNTIKKHSIKFLKSLLYLPILLFVFQILSFFLPLVYILVKTL